MTDIEKLIALIGEGRQKRADICYDNADCSLCKYDADGYNCGDGIIADHLLANGVTFATDNTVGGKWIPVTERLPEHKQLVFVTDTDGSVFSTLFYSEEYFRRNYTHWMPLPEPPMRKGENG